MPPGWRLPVLGPSYVANEAGPQLVTILNDMDAFTPAIYLLSIGSDPTEMIETLARKSYRTVRIQALFTPWWPSVRGGVWLSLCFLSLVMSRAAGLCVHW